MAFIKVPATTANIGPGFDSMGIALDLFNSVEISESDSKSFDWNNTGISLSEEKNLIIYSLEFTFKKYNVNHGYSIKAIDMDIPVSRGLGSSAASVVLGILCANFLMGYPLNDDEMLLIANEIEGHPDNVAPALLGGMVTSVVSDEKILYSKINVPDNVVFMTVIPDFKLSTEMARKALPDSYSKADCIFNISRVALLVSSLNNGELENLRISLDDRIHQNYRMPLIPHCKDIFDISEKSGAIGEFISGAGPTMISLVGNNHSKFADKMRSHLASKGLNWDLKELNINKNGYQIVEV